VFEAFFLSNKISIQKDLHKQSNNFGTFHNVHGTQQISFLAVAKTTQLWGRLCKLSSSAQLWQIFFSVPQFCHRERSAMAFIRDVHKGFLRVQNCACLVPSSLPSRREFCEFWALYSYLIRVLLILR
jgi:hypothetical protein